MPPNHSIALCSVTRARYMHTGFCATFLTGSCSRVGGKLASHSGDKGSNLGSQPRCGFSLFTYLPLDCRPSEIPGLPNYGVPFFPIVFIV